MAVDQPFRFPAAFTFVLRAFSTLEGLGKALDPDYSFAVVAQPFGEELLNLQVCQRVSSQAGWLTSASVRGWSGWLAAAILWLCSRQQGCLCWGSTPANACLWASRVHLILSAACSANQQGMPQATGRLAEDRMPPYALHGLCTASPICTTLACTTCQLETLPNAGRWQLLGLYVCQAQAPLCRAQAALVSTLGSGRCEANSVRPWLSASRAAASAGP